MSLTAVEFAMSVTALVGRPPSKKKASILPSRSASAESCALRRCGWISVVALRPYASRIRMPLVSGYHAAGPAGDDVEGLAGEVRRVARARGGRGFRRGPGRLARGADEERCQRDR